jgi:saccharopine dehydrogenase-like NADP-dependent oxidoreductase
MPYSILILGAGRSSSSLISHLIGQMATLDLTITIGDVSWEAANQKAANKAKAIQFDIFNKPESREVIKQHDIIVSLMPATLHAHVAELCLVCKKHLLTASYLTEKMRGYDEEAKKLGLLFLNECGLDPGIDHMTAMEIIDTIRQENGVIESFESFTGGLIAPQTDPQNPWRYKFTWNPRNVVLAGQGTAKFLQNGKNKYIPYQQLFKRITPITIPSVGEFEGYANRDSLGYLDVYGLTEVKTMVRGTLRNKGFCASWNALVQLGCTDDTYELNLTNKITHRDFIELFLNDFGDVPTKKKLAKALALEEGGHELNCLDWSGFFDDELIDMQKGTPAQIVEHILNKKWKLNDADRDLVVMWHRFHYLVDGRKHEMQASLYATGENATHTAMAKTVGLPLAVAVELLVKKELTERGVLIPTIKQIYKPILRELKKLGIVLVHHTHLQDR